MFTVIPKTIMVDGNTFPDRPEEPEHKGCYALRGEDIAILHEMIRERTSLVPDVLPIPEMSAHPMKTPLRQMCNALASSVIVDRDGRDSPFGVTSCITSLSGALKDVVPKTARGEYSETYTDKYDGCTIEDYWGPDADGYPPSTPQPDSYCNCVDDKHQIEHQEQWTETTYRTEPDEGTGEDHEVDVEKESMGDASSRFSEAVQAAIRKAYDSPGLLTLLDETAEEFAPQNERVPLDPEVVKKLVSGVDKDVKAVIVPFSADRILVRGGFVSYDPVRDPPNPGGPDDYASLEYAVCRLRGSMPHPGWFPILDPLYYVAATDDANCVSRTNTGLSTSTIQDHYGRVSTTEFSYVQGESIATSDGRLYITQQLLLDDFGNPAPGIESIECVVYSSIATLSFTTTDIEVEKCRTVNNELVYHCPPTERTRESGLTVKVKTTAVPVKFTLDRIDPEEGKAWYVSATTLGSLVPLEGGRPDTNSGSTSDDSGESNECAPSSTTSTETWDNQVHFISDVAPFALYVLTPRARASGSPVDTGGTAGDQ
jgi:hypothetical protein